MGLVIGPDRHKDTVRFRFLVHLGIREPDLEALQLLFPHCRGPVASGNYTLHSLFNSSGVLSGQRDVFYRLSAVVLDQDRDPVSVHSPDPADFKAAVCRGGASRAQSAGIGRSCLDIGTINRFAVQILAGASQRIAGIAQGAADRILNVLCRIDFLRIQKDHVSVLPRVRQQVQRIALDGLSPLFHLPDRAVFSFPVRCRWKNGKRIGAACHRSGGRRACRRVIDLQDVRVFDLLQLPSGEFESPLPDLLVDLGGCDHSLQRKIFLRRFRHPHLNDVVAYGKDRCKTVFRIFQHHRRDGIVSPGKHVLGAHAAGISVVYETLLLERIIDKVFVAGFRDSRKVDLVSHVIAGHGLRLGSLFSQREVRVFKVSFAGGKDLKNDRAGLKMRPDLQDSIVSFFRGINFFCQLVDLLDQFLREFNTVGRTVRNLDGAAVPAGDDIFVQDPVHVSGLTFRICYRTIEHRVHLEFDALTHIVLFPGSISNLTVDPDPCRCFLHLIGGACPPEFQRFRILHLDPEFPVQKDERIYIHFRRPEAAAILFGEYPERLHFAHGRNGILRDRFRIRAGYHSGVFDIEQPERIIVKPPALLFPVAGLTP